MNTWQTIWHQGFAPHVGDKGLIALRDALQNDDPRLIQGATTSPPPLACCSDWPPDGACAFGYCGWHDNDLKTVEEVETFFATSCAAVDRVLREPAACRDFLNWFDETPRDTMRQELLREVEITLAQRVRESETPSTQRPVNGVRGA